MPEMKYDISLVADVAGPCVPTKIRDRDACVKPFTPNLGSTEYLTQIGLLDKGYFNEMVRAHDKREKEPDKYSQLDLVIDTHNSLARALHGKRIRDIEDGGRKYWAKLLKDLQYAEQILPHPNPRQLMRDSKHYGKIVAVTGDLEAYVRAYSDEVLKPLGIEFDEVLGFSPDADNEYYVADRTEIREFETAKGMMQKEIIIMKKRMDTPKDKLAAIIGDEKNKGIMTEDELANAMVWGDTESEYELFMHAGYPCMVDASSSLISHPEARNWGILSTTRNYIAREYVVSVRKMMDFLYCFPSKVEMSYGDYIISLERKITDRYNRVLTLDIRPTSSIGKILEVFHGRKTVGIHPEITREEYSKLRLVKKREMPQELIDSIWDVIEQLRARSKLNELEEIGTTKKPKKRKG